MSAITERMAAAPRIPLRAVAVVALLILALVAAAIYVGSQQRRLPEPFGPAGNGLIAYSSAGDIYTADSLTGAATAIVTGPEWDRNPIFSRDGTKIVFRRQGERLTEFDLVVVDADGSNLRVVSTSPMSAQDPIEWTADSTGLIALTEDEEIVRLDAAKAAPVQVLATQIGAAGSIVFNASLRPPDGNEILFRDTADSKIQVMNLDGSDVRTLLETSDYAGLDVFAWSPDGSMIAFTAGVDGFVVGAEGNRIFVMNADGTDVHQLLPAAGGLQMTWFAWSPDSTRIAFNSWQQKEVGWQIQPLRLVTVADGTVVDGPVPVSEGTVFQWSPDGSTILSLPGPVHDGVPGGDTAKPILIDSATGTSHELDVDVQSATSWQRVATD
jgi:Tol biopolymer transport system component